MDANKNIGLYQDLIKNIVTRDELISPEYKEGFRCINYDFTITND